MLLICEINYKNVPLKLYVSQFSNLNIESLLSSTVITVVYFTPLTIVVPLPHP